MQKVRLNISKSLINDYWDYKAEKLCGYYFQLVHIDKEVSGAPSRAGILGQYFEYKCVGYTSGNATELDANMHKFGLYLKNGSPSTELRRVEAQISSFKRQIAEMDINLAETGEMIEYDGFKAITDVFAVYKGRRCIIDLKTTAMMDNKWEDYGWDFDSLEGKDKIMIQAKLIKWIWKKLTKDDITFYFWVFSKTDSGDQNLFEIGIQPDTMEIFESYLIRLKSEIYKDYVSGFEPAPEYNRCKKCPFNEKCKHKTNIVEPKIIWL